MRIELLPARTPLQGKHAGLPCTTATLHSVEHDRRGQATALGAEGGLEVGNTRKQVHTAMRCPASFSVKAKKLGAGCIKKG
jgi:hypothetical protein